MGHPIVGQSWEGFVIENLINAAPEGTEASFYRASGGAEVDLILVLPGRKPWVIEIKRGLEPKLKKGFYHACEDIEPEAQFVVYSGAERFPIAGSLEAINVRDLAYELTQAGKL